MAAEGYYLHRNLVTNFRDKYRTRLEPGRRTLRNDLVLNAWGLALRPAGAGGHWWIANTDSGAVVTYIGDTDTTPLFQDALKTVWRCGPRRGLSRWQSRSAVASSTHGLSLEHDIEHDVRVDEELRDCRHRTDRHEGLS